ncbi:hypothetical protein PIB30_066478 [Stylosanthes scabra]|uniref:Putative plant transposon protein domain-containing protein n=1 Tax=Stylosanthes scabra TaxID=79078 RepID=A0ABU6ZL53_9FABA|nr:hypothetical protein [Stylosanthes scabra]
MKKQRKKKKIENRESLSQVTENPSSSKATSRSRLDHVSDIAKSHTWPKHDLPRLTKARPSLPTRNKGHVWLKYTLDPNVTHSRQGKASQPHHQVTFEPRLDVGQIKRKGKAVSSSSQVTPRFKSLYHEAHFNSKLSARRILPELILQADEHIFNPIRFQIHQRKWEKFIKPIQAVGRFMVKEFYANAWEPDKARRKHLTYTSMVRGTEISFAPSNIKRVLKLRNDPIPNAPSYHERKANEDFRLDHILYDMCEEGAEWVRHRDGRPHYLRRSDLEPMPKGWYEFVCRSILPTTNRSELTIERAMLIHSIIIGENINVEEIIAEQIYKFVYKTGISSSLLFPSIIAALCVDAKIPAIPDDTLILQEPLIVAEAMARTRESRERNPR